MVQNIIHISEHEDRVINIIKTKYGLRTKSEAISLIVKSYESTFLEPRLRPKYLNRLNKIRKGKYSKFNSIEDLRKQIEE